MGEVFAMSTKATFIVPAGLLFVVFVVGVVVGRVAQEKPKATATTSVKTVLAPEVEEVLAACQEGLGAYSMPRASASAADAVTDEAKRAAAEEDAKAEVMEKELRQCKTRDMVFNADMCRTADRYFYLLLAGLHADKACADRFGVGDLILKHTEQCAKFEDQTDPKDMDIGELSDAELSHLYDAQRYGRWSEHRVLAGDHKANIGRHFKRTLRECRAKFGLSNE
jgi:hypothetical protein